jgi:hypothetical protein
MSQTVTISNELYTRLELTARRRGLDDVEQLLGQWLTSEDERQRRAEAVPQADGLHTRLLETFGEMADSTDRIRDDRERQRPLRSLTLPARPVGCGSHS